MGSSGGRRRGRSADARPLDAVSTMSPRPRIGVFVVASAKAAGGGALAWGRRRRAADLPGGPAEPPARGLAGGDADADLAAGDGARGVRLLRHRAARRGLDARAARRLPRLPP